MVRGFCGTMLVRGSSGCELTTIVWIARPCVAHCVELIMKCSNVMHVNPLTNVIYVIYVLKCSNCITCIRVSFSKKDFMF